MCSHAHDDREHECDSSRIAHKGSDEGGHQHHKEEKSGLAGSREADHLATDHLGQTCLENTTSHDEQSDHHDYGRVRESGQSFCRGQNLAEEQGEEIAIEPIEGEVEA